MPVDYWNQFINTDDENVRSPPFNPATHHRDGTPITPECRPGEIHKTADTHFQEGRSFDRPGFYLGFFAWGRSPEWLQEILAPGNFVK